MVEYKVVHHVPGRIRIEIPLIKGIPIERLGRLSGLLIPSGVKTIRPNPVTGSLVIRYDPQQINILSYVDEMASSSEVEALLGRMTGYETHA